MDPMEVSQLKRPLVGGSRRSIVGSAVAVLAVALGVPSWLYSVRLPRSQPVGRRSV